MCARTGTWLLHFSTSEVYGRTLASYATPGVYDESSLFELDEDSTPLVMGVIQNQRWTYACAKQLLERLIFAFHHEQSLPFTIVRPLNFFGSPMDYVDGLDGSAFLECWRASWARCFVVSHCASSTAGPPGERSSRFTTPSMP